MFHCRCSLYCFKIANFFSNQTIQWLSKRQCPMPKPSFKLQRFLQRHRKENFSQNCECLGKLKVCDSRLSNNGNCFKSLNTASAVKHLLHSNKKKRDKYNVLKGTMYILLQLWRQILWKCAFHINRIHSIHPYCTQFTCNNQITFHKKGLNHESWRAVPQWTTLMSFPLTRRWGHFVHELPLSSAVCTKNLNYIMLYCGCYEFC